MRHVQKIDRKPVRGSLKWIREAVNARQYLLDNDIRDELSLLSDSPLEWVSPVSADEYAEYSDQEFLDQLGIKLNKTPLKSFWPNRGPNWDALARTKADPPTVFLVEAKAHTGELMSGPSSAKAPAAVEMIGTALRRTKEFIGVSPEYDWTGTYYQYANRLAHLYLLRVLNGIDAYLVYVCFLNDVEMKGPTTVDKWQNAIAEAESALGIRDNRLSPYVAHIFIDVNQLDEPEEE